MTAPPSDIDGPASAAPAGVEADDHERGCQGREYTCSCGYDARVATALASAQAREAELQAKLEVATAEIASITALINSPETEDWLAGVPIESAHQVERWGAEQDAGKTALDWFWLIGYLAQKATTAAQSGDVAKAKHHTISTAAALLNWHRHLIGKATAMRPGIDPVERGIS